MWLNEAKNIRLHFGERFWNLNNECIIQWCLGLGHHYLANSHNNIEKPSGNNQFRGISSDLLSVQLHQFQVFSFLQLCNILVSSTTPGKFSLSLAGSSSFVHLLTMDILQGLVFKLLLCSLLFFRDLIYTHGFGCHNYALESVTYHPHASLPLPQNHTLRSELMILPQNWLFLLVSLC